MMNHNSNSSNLSSKCNNSNLSSKFIIKNNQFTINNKCNKILNSKNNNLMSWIYIINLSYNLLNNNYSSISIQIMVFKYNKDNNNNKITIEICISNVHNIKCSQTNTIINKINTIINFRTHNKCITNKDNNKCKCNNSIDNHNNKWEWAYNILLKFNTNHNNNNNTKNINNNINLSSLLLNKIR